MIIINNGVANLLSIPTRNHYDLQSLNVSDDHLLYMPGGLYHNVAGITYGLDASKPGTIAVNNVYVATDSKKIYLSYAVNTWTEIRGVTVESTAVQGDMLWRDTNGWRRFPAGTSGQILRSNGSAAAPSWQQPTTGLLFQNATEADVVLNSAAYTTIDTNTLNGGVLGTNGTLHYHVEGNSDLGAAISQLFQIVYGSTALFTLTIAAAGAVTPEWSLDVWIYANASTGAQFARAELRTDGTPTKYIYYAKGTATEDSTTNKALTLQAKSSSGTPTFRRYAYNVRQIT